MTERWAITGGSGYVGRHLAAALIADGHRVRILSRDARRTFDGAELVTGDIRDREALRALVDEATTVVHLAGFVHRPALDAAAERECFDVNAGGTMALIETVRLHAPQAFVIGISTSAVYGGGDGVKREDDAARPATPYGRSKLAAEELVLGDGGTVLRPPIIIGANAPGNFQRLVRLVRRGWFPRIGSRSPRKSILPVDDLVDAIRAVVARADACRGERFNVSGSEILTMEEIAREIASALGTRLRMLPVPALPLRLAARAWPRLESSLTAFTSDAVIDDTKLRALLDLRPRDVRQAIREAAVASR